MPFGWGESEESYKQIQDGGVEPNEANFGHEALAGAAAFGALKIYEDRQRKSGKVVEHQFAKEALAGIAGALVDRLVETKGMDYIDSEHAKRAAKENVNELYNDHYGKGNDFNPSANSHESMGKYRGDRGMADLVEDEN